MDGDDLPSGSADNDEGDFDDALTDFERMALELVAAGHSHEVAAAFVSRQAKWTQRLLKRPEARAFVAMRRAERLAEVTGVLNDGLVRAAQTVVAELDGPNATTRLRAAEMVLKRWELLVASHQLDTTIEDLRAELADLNARLDESR